MRGLKLSSATLHENFPESHALRVRGLKPIVGIQLEKERPVARSTRAWIETFPPDGGRLVVRVARSTRAWIETMLNTALKFLATVARSTRAWIETS